MDQPDRCLGGDLITSLMVYTKTGKLRRKRKRRYMYGLYILSIVHIDVYILLIGYRVTLITSFILQPVNFTITISTFLF